MTADPAAPNDLWIFGYGSLMWNPGFDYEEKAAGKLIGAHRSLCVTSIHWRGTPEKPGLVLGLDQGGACVGLAFRVAPARAAATLAYLRAREQVTTVYREAVRRVWLKDGSARVVPAVVYLVDRGHAQYAGALTREERLHLIRQGHGVGGPNGDYVAATLRHLDELGIRDADMRWLMERL
ncbi:gamma-glutamylcyclotransferase [Ancylobacter amanitiformis]|uniref:glutathione-specific gamma-glutamylcyclotransferase n=1 Tax=Ancylobacter amanitiformis TaxID=217069 RepID=A0ABU0LRM7_9HYPH|nr:gamma-glutamylcyclotransferase [Ancylobacter amanitiformis]MDQ0511360.1 cation transport protein ChaC [Ancylobacter amanitiformis]